MANSNFPAGFISRRNAAGGQHNDALRTYRTDPTDATPIFIGDPVVKSGKVDINGTPYVTRATAGAGNYVTGVCGGFTGPQLLGAGTTTYKYRPANFDGFILVEDDPDTLFEIQESANYGVAMAGKNVNFLIANGNTFTGVSGVQLDSTSPATAATGQFKVISARDIVDWQPGTTSTITNNAGQNDPTSANCKWLGKWNLHTEAPGTAGR